MAVVRLITCWEGRNREGQQCFRVIRKDLANANQERYHDHIQQPWKELLWRDIRKRPSARWIPHWQTVLKIARVKRCRNCWIIVLRCLPRPEPCTVVSGHEDKYKHELIHASRKRAPGEARTRRHGRVRYAEDSNRRFLVFARRA